MAAGSCGEEGGILSQALFMRPVDLRRAIVHHRAVTFPGHPDMKERRSVEPRRGSDARTERTYDAARRRMDGLEKALSLIAGSMVPGSHQVDQSKLAEFRLGIDIARSLLSARFGSAGAAQPERRKREEGAGVESTGT
jgi:hypothetical protein